MVRRFLDRTVKGLRVMADCYGLVGSFVVGIVSYLWLVAAYQFGGLAGLAVGLALLVVWPSLFARAMEPDPSDETEFGATFDALQRRDREILERNERTREHEHLSRLRDQWNTRAQDAANGPRRSGVEM